MSETATKVFDPYHVWLGIPPADQPANYYRLLGITLFESDPDVIASAADRQMTHVRSFQSGKHAEQSQQLLNEISRAKVNLLHREKKAEYDKKLEKQLMPAGADKHPTRRLPVAQPLEPKPAPKAKPNVASKQTVTSDAKPGRAHSQHSWGVLLGAVGGGIAAVLIAMLWWTLRAAPEVPSVTAAAPVSRPVTKDPSKPSTTVIPIESHGPQWQTAESPESSTVSSLTPPSAQSEASALPDVRTDDASSGDQPDFDQPETTSAAPAAPSPDSNSDKTVKVENSVQGKAVSDLAKQKKLAVPASDLQHSIRLQLASLYQPSQATTPADKIKVSRELVKVAQTLEVADERFVALSQAIDLAGEAGDPALVLQIIDLIGDQFDIDVHQRREDALTRFAQSARSGEQFAALVAASERAIKQSLSDEKHEHARNIAELVVRACQRLPGREFRKEALERRAWVEMIGSRQEEVRLARAALEENPEDGAANLTLARWYCLFNDDWKNGLPHLAKCGDEQLRKIASQDAATATDAETDVLIAVGDAWWDLAQRRKGDEREPFLLRAGHWYQHALDGSAAGLKRIRLEKRMEELADTGKQYQSRLALNSLEISKAALWTDAAP